MKNPKSFSPTPYNYNKVIDHSGPGTPSGVTSKKAKKPHGLEMPKPIETALPNLGGEDKIPTRVAKAPMGLESPSAINHSGPGTPKEIKKWHKKGRYTLTGSILQDFGKA